MSKRVIVKQLTNGDYLFRWPGLGRKVVVPFENIESQLTPEFNRAYYVSTIVPIRECEK